MYHTRYLDSCAGTNRSNAFWGLDYLHYSMEGKTVEKFGRLQHRSQEDAIDGTLGTDDLYDPFPLHDLDLSR